MALLKPEVMALLKPEMIEMASLKPEIIESALDMAETAATTQQT